MCWCSSMVLPCPLLLVPSVAAVSPSTEMVEQGLAREVVNRIQKLRKKANLQPTDAVEVARTTACTVAHGPPRSTAA